jgi:SAM-dependent methyltransferase
MPTRRRVPLYANDLTQIHIEGYAFHWECAAPGVLDWLRGAGIHEGTVVDLGCGGGRWLARLAEGGYATVGVDVSTAMIRAARKRAPAARLVRGSLPDVELPPCDAATSLGEPLNYLPSRASFRRALKRVSCSLRPGGLFVFDVRVPATKPVETRVSARVGNDWACISFNDEYPSANRLVRRITTFRRHGNSYRRCEEIHELRLYGSREIRGWLRAVGFRVRTSPSYGEYRLGPRQVVFVARKSD